MASDVVDAWKTCLSLARPLSFAWELNAVLVIDNWRILHGRERSAVASDDVRVLERIVVS
jgi:alpha-ketoglutarate-dependent taurine dioxygenase